MKTGTHPYARFRGVIYARWLTLDELIRIDNPRWQRELIAAFLTERDAEARG